MGVISLHVGVEMLGFAALTDGYFVLTVWRSAALAVITWQASL